MNSDQKKKRECLSVSAVAQIMADICETADKTGILMISTGETYISVSDVETIINSYINFDK